MTHPTTLSGLSLADVAERTRAGRVNVAEAPTSRSIGAIVRDNTLTLFNAILLTCLVVVLLVGHARDAVFAGVLILNALTGIVSEIRAKRTLDKLAILSTSPIAVIREGEETTIAPSAIVEGDLMVLRAGDQVPADGEIVRNCAVQLDEAILTGESVPVHKDVGERVLAGSVVVAGEAAVTADKVGADSWAYGVSSEVKKFRLAHSELSEGIDTILRLLTRILPIMILILGASQIEWSAGLDHVLTSGQWKRAVIAIVAALVGMIPQGLVLLTSVNFAAAAMKLARRNVLVQELPAVEVLARVDVLCLDKTGTITTGQMACIGAEEPGGYQLGDLATMATGELKRALAMVASDRTNATAIALADALAYEVGEPDVRVAFTSRTKWSAIRTESTTWVLGAPDIVGEACDNTSAIAETARHFMDAGWRALALASTPTPITPGTEVLPGGLTGRLLVAFAEEIRPDAADTLAYFADQGVDVRIISGDAPGTVSAIARNAGLRFDQAEVCDARTLPTPAAPVDRTKQRPRRSRPVPPAGSLDFDDAAEHHKVFARVTPEQKRALVHALQRRGHTVAMTGDGVNDALALKDADLGIAMGSGAQATKAAAKVVLLDSRFSHLPAVVDEGRRVLGNMERVSTLFLAKTTWAFLFSIVVSALALDYPFLPRHLTLIGVFTIGLPAFLLALAPSKARYRPGFLRRVLALVLPGGAIIGVAGLGMYIWWEGVDHTLAQTMCTLAVTGCSLAFLAVLAKPLLSWRGIMVAIMGTCVVLATLVPQLRHFFALEWPTLTQWLIVTGVVGLGVCAIGVLGVWWSRRYYSHVA